MREVVGLLSDERPVGDPEEGGDGVVPQRGDGLGREEVAGRHDRQHHHDQRGQQPAGTPNPEAAQGDPPGATEFVEKQRGDQESTEHKEDVDPEESAGQARDSAVVGQHERDGDGADAVQRGDVATPTRAAISGRDVSARSHLRNLARASRRKSPRHAEDRGAFTSARVG